MLFYGIKMKDLEMHEFLPNTAFVFGVFSEDIYIQVHNLGNKVLS